MPNFILRAVDVGFRNVLKYPELGIEEGKASFLHGPSGCGKSTLLRLFNGVLSPDEGRLFYDENDIATLDTIALRREVLLVGQDVFLFSETISENFRLFSDFLDVPAPEENEIRTFLRLCDAEFPLETPCDTLSGGERQRVFLALGLSRRPRVLMLDEPTSALDHATARRVMSRVLEFCRENQITVLAVSHDDEILAEFADTVLELGNTAQNRKETSK